MIQHIYSNIEGWFDFPEFYDLLIERLPQNFVFVELGVWKGKSLSYFVIESINRNKTGQIHAVDHWLGSAEHQKNAPSYDPALDIPDGLYNIYLKNIYPIKDYISTHRKSSEEASSLFSSKSIDAIFIDASHDYESVYQDLMCWYPKIKMNGTLCGHDYNWPEVKKAVEEFSQTYGLNISIHNSVWETVIS
jgi:hypothetical protein